jgi:hypothetical protein
MYTHLLTPAALEATKALVRLVLQREREGNLDAPAGLSQQLDAVPKEALLASIRRHRLECLLHGDPIVARLLPDLAPALQALARQDAMAAMALASLTRKMASLFEQAAMPMLVIKGIPLALQTTGSLIARGRGDLDLLVDTKRLPEAVALLESAGFSRCPGQFPRQLNSVWGRYSRWAGYEFSLVRQSPAGLQWIDLHWALANAREPLPSFALAWHCGEQLALNDQIVATLSRLHAFQHACAHAATDQWMCLRNLIDVDRLANQLKGIDLSKLHHQPTVRWSCAVTHVVTGSEALSRRNLGHASGSSRAMVWAAHAQLMPWRSQGPGPWTPRRWASTVWRLLVLSHDARDWIRTLLFYTLLPAAFSDPETGEDRGLAGFLQARIARLRQRLNERQGTSNQASASR